MATKKTETAAAAAVTETAAAAETAGEAKSAVVDDGKVDLYVEKGYANDEPNLLISVNGVNYLLPKGKTSRVPKHIAEEYRRSQRAREKQDERKDTLLNAAK